MAQVKEAYGGNNPGIRHHLDQVLLLIKTYSQVLTILKNTMQNQQLELGQLMQMQPDLHL